MTDSGARTAAILAGVDVGGSKIAVVLADDAISSSSPGTRSRPASGDAGYAVNRIAEARRRDARDRRT